MTRTASSKPAGLVITSVVIGAAVVLFAYLVWALRNLILPASVGGLLAYICRPLVARLERYRIPRSVGIGLLLLTFGLAGVGGFNRIRAAMPSEAEALELRVRAVYALNRRYQAMMGLDPSWTHGNRLYSFARTDLDPMLNRVNEIIGLAPEERAQFLASHQRGSGETSARSKRLLEYDRANTQILEIRAGRIGRGEPATRTLEGLPSSLEPTSVEKSAAAKLGGILAIWAIAPLTFLFLLRDTETIKRGLLRGVPNRLFEPALAVLDDVDHALGDYLRGVFLECCSLGLTVMVFIAIVGVPLTWAIAIGIFAGAGNVIPYMGSAAALLGGLGYALLAEDVHSILPLVTPETFPIWIVGAVVLAELLKNVVYEPIVLGGAVKLHPLAVVIGGIGGAILFGPAGLFLAIPTITVVKVLVGSSIRHLRACGLISLESTWPAAHSLAPTH